ncbi:hypothetical protein [Streptosporangium carneum]|uniref:SCO6045-like C-terminal domain-containing protein n=1 Tax=Streptosporangium carneum TaxID=47481 RepID=A0A9W6MEJ8_9ACTN|nr:hypothetical protein [Streptosporangium carneum]GLK11664.1 hypothetical protein GCM10017600_50710 [Streptosporangium carneum]
MPDRSAAHGPAHSAAHSPARSAEHGPGDGAGSGAREALARAQAGLVAALVAGGEPPEGFDVGRLRIQEAALISKRRGTVARLRPDLCALLGDAFAAEFDGYARGRPKPQGGSRVDAQDFARWLGEKGLLPQEPDPEARVDPAPGLRSRLGRWVSRSRSRARGRDRAREWGS